VSLSRSRSVQPMIPRPTSRIVLILSSYPRLGFQSGFVPSGFHTKTLYAPTLSPIHAIRPAHHILLKFIFCDYTLNSSLCTFLYSLLTLSLLGPNILLGTQFSDTLSQCSSLDMSNHSHPHKTTGKIIILYILNFIFLDSKLEDKGICTQL